MPFIASLFLFLRKSVSPLSMFVQAPAADLSAGSSLLKPAGRRESLQPESGSLLLYLIWIGSGSCRAVAYLLTRGVRFGAWDRNSFSWACSSATQNCPVKAFEDETPSDPVRFNGEI